MKPKKQQCYHNFVCVVFDDDRSLSYACDCVADCEYALNECYDSLVLSL
jgi:hypothetical protein